MLLFLSFCGVLEYPSYISDSLVEKKKGIHSPNPKWGLFIGMVSLWGEFCLWTYNGEKCFCPYAYSFHKTLEV